jgi:predicted Zn-dependent protease
MDEVAAMRLTNKRLINRCFSLLCGVLLLTGLHASGFASVQKALSLYQQKQYTQSAQLFAKASQQGDLSKSQRANILYYQADALYRAGKTTQAGKAYQQVAALAPDSKAGQYATIALKRMTAIEAAKATAKSSDKSGRNPSNSKLAATNPANTATNTSKQATNKQAHAQSGNHAQPDAAQKLATVKAKALPSKVAAADKPQVVSTTAPKTTPKLMATATTVKSPTLKATTPKLTNASVAKSAMTRTVANKSVVATTIAKSPASKVAITAAPVLMASATPSKNTLAKNSLAKKPTSATGDTQLLATQLTTQPASTKAMVLTEKGQYLDRMTLSGMRVKWAKQPITYFIDPPPKGIKSFSSTYRSEVQKAFSRWQNGTRNAVQFASTSSPATARIWVRWANQVDSQGQGVETGTRYTAGYTIPQINNNQLQRMQITLAVMDLQGKPTTTMGVTALHEVGHALGLMGHSNLDTDVMAATARPNAALTPRDINTVIALYAQPAHITENPFKTPDTIEQAAIAAKRQNDITQLEQQVKKDPSLTLFNQLADNYRREADNSKDNRYKRQWWNKALASLNQCEKRYPKDGITQLNKAVIASYLAQWPVANTAITQAAKLLPEQAEVFITQAEIANAQQQSAAARNALSTYERLTSRTERQSQKRYAVLKQALAVKTVSKASASSAKSTMAPVTAVNTSADKSADLPGAFVAINAAVPAKKAEVNTPATGTTPDKTADERNTMEAAFELVPVRQRPVNQASANQPLTAPATGDLATHQPQAVLPQLVAPQSVVMPKGNELLPQLPVLKLNH